MNTFNSTQIHTIKISTRSTNHRLSFALGCALFAIYCSAANAKANSTQELIAGPAATPIEALDSEMPASVIEYPSEERMIEIYTLMTAGGYLVAGEGPLHPKLDIETLRAVYRYALETKFFEKVLPNTKGPTQVDIGIAKAIPRKRTAACLGAWGTCGFEAFSLNAAWTSTACGAATFSWGTLAPADAICAVGIASLTSVCISLLVQECTHDDAAPAPKAEVRLGKATGLTEVVSTCGNGLAIKSARFARKGGSLTGITMTCTDNTKFYFGDSSNATLYTQTCNAVAGEVMVGFGSYTDTNMIYGMGIMCSKLGAPHSKNVQQSIAGKKPFTNTIFDSYCVDEGRHIVGGKAFVDTNGYVRGFTPYCM